ncbi:MAG: PD-(D/E)XK nuclease family transposase, partial [Prevotella sp.]|nr:PD-(D/E)XK nuclease family transposase [Prevotella sp.]
MQKDYSDLKAVYIVSLLNFRMDSISTDFRCDVGLMDIRRKVPFSDKMRLVYLQMPRFTKTVDECETLFDKIIYVLKNMDV